MQPKLFLASLTMFFFVQTSAQFVKGSRMLGATIATGFITTGDNKVSGTNQISSTLRQTNTSISLTPSIGWFVNSNTIAGGSFLFQRSTVKVRQIVNGITNKKDNSKLLDFGLGGFIRYYLNTNNSLRPFAHAYINGGSGNLKTDGIYYYSSSPGSSDKSTYEANSTGRFFYNAGLNAGVTKMLNDNLGLDIFIGYGFSHTQTDMQGKQVNDFGNPAIPDTISEYDSKQNFNSNSVNFGLGFQLFLSKRKK